MKVARISNHKMVSQFIPYLEDKFGFNTRHELKEWLYGSSEINLSLSNWKICLGKDIFIILSPRDFRIVAALHVFAKIRRRGNLNALDVRVRLNNKDVSLGRFLTDAKEGEIVTFRNGDSYDYRRQNLLITDKRRKIKAPNTSSMFLGVSEITIGKWAARIYCNGKNFNLGTFYKEAEAAKVYDDAARRLFGPSARLNFPNEGERPALDCAA